MRLKLFSKFFATNTVGIFRRLFIVLLSIWLVATFFVYSGAWFSEVITSRGNEISTENQRLRLLATDTPITIYSENGEPTVAPDLPKTVSDLFADNNAIISLDAYDNDYKRKFLEFNGETGIQNVGANFRQQRALIISSESDEILTYSLAFKTQELGQNSLSSAFYFNYTRVGGDIPNIDFHETSGIKLDASQPVDNLGVKIETIGSKNPVVIQPRNTHVYIVDMGILDSAGNSYLNAGLQLDIVLTMSRSALATYYIEDAKSLENAIKENVGGTTFILNNDIIIDTPIKSDDVFNLDLNGFILEFVGDGALEVKFPKRQATMDIGSIQGGQIHGADAMTFIGVNGKSVLNWYPDITGLNQPSSCKDVIINSMSIPDYSPPSSRPNVSSDESSSNSSDNSSSNSSGNSSNNSSGNSSNNSSGNSSSNSSNSSSENSSSNSSNSSSGNSSSNSSNSSSENSSSNSSNSSSENSSSNSSNSSSENSSSNSSNSSSENSSGSSSDNSSNSSDNSELLGYTNYDDINMSENYSGGSGTAESPYLIKSIGQFKLFIEDTSTNTNVYFKLHVIISHIKNIPAYAIQKGAGLMFEQDCILEYLDFNAPTPSITPDNPFKNIHFYTTDGYRGNYSSYLFNVSYNGV